MRGGIRISLGLRAIAASSSHTAVVAAARRPAAIATRRAQRPALATVTLIPVPKARGPAPRGGLFDRGATCSHATGSGLSGLAAPGMGSTRARRRVAGRVVWPRAVMVTVVWTEDVD